MEARAEPLHEVKSKTWGGDKQLLEGSGEERRREEGERGGKQKKCPLEDLSRPQRASDATARAKLGPGGAGAQHLLNAINLKLYLHVRRCKILQSVVHHCFVSST